MMSIYVSQIVYSEGDVLRIPAQVISGIGFLGAGMIILKNNNVITGLTTAVGVWTTSIIGIAIGYGFYVGVITASVLFWVTIILFAKFERRKTTTEVIYIEIDNMYRTNKILNELKKLIKTDFSQNTTIPKSGLQGNLGINLIIEKRLELEIDLICNMNNVVYVEEE